MALAKLVLDSVERYGCVVTEVEKKTVRMHWIVRCLKVPFWRWWRMPDPPAFVTHAKRQNFGRRRLPFNKLLSFGVSRADYAGTCNCHLGSSKDLDLWVGF